MELRPIQSGTYSSPIQAVDADYTISYVPGELTITPAPLTIAADDKSKIYGDPLPTLTASYSGLVNGDTAANLTTPPTLSTTATAGSHVSGSPYAITASGAADANYTIGYRSGALQITPATLIVTADDKTKAYGTVLNRAPEPGALPFWEQQLAGGMSEGQVTLQFFTSREADDDDVTGWFEEYLGRTPSSAELAQYANQMLGGANARDIEQAITNLAEYSANPPDSPPGTGVRLPDYFPASNTAQAKRQAQLAATDAVFAQHS